VFLPRINCSGFFTGTKGTASRAKTGRVLRGRIAGPEALHGRADEACCIGRGITMPPLRWWPGNWAKRSLPRGSRGDG